jgi:molybdenum-dependent DNA-binding transcriptional regulator ModE
MLRQRFISVAATIMMGPVVLLTLMAEGRCQDESPHDADVEPTETIEEIVVYGSKTLLQLRLDLYLAEEVVFELFNSLNSNDEFDIHCDKETTVGSRLQHRVCKPNYVDLLTAQATSHSIVTGAGGVNLSYAHAVTKIREKDQQLTEEMEAMVVERPELRKVLSEFADAKKILEAEHERRCADKTILCKQ